MSDPVEEYRTAAAAAGWRVDRRRGRLRVAGRDASAFLHALVTADVAGVREGGGTYAAYLTPQGRMITDLALYRIDSGWLIDLPSGVAPGLLTRLDSLIFAEDVTLTDLLDVTALVSVVGHRAADIVARALGADATLLASLPLRSTLSKDGALVARTDAATVATYDVFCPVEHLGAVGRGLTEAGGVEIAEETANTFRIEAGHPAFGVDMTSETIPLEAGLLDRAISLSKGCYVGQEVIVRVLHRGGGRVAKRLMVIEASDDVQAQSAGTDSLAARVAPGATISVGDREVGAVTSAAFSPARARSIALGYVHRDFAADGQAVRLQWAAGHVDAVVVGAAG